MTAILGYFHRDFQTSYPRKLCRRRERWIESPPTDVASPQIFRLVISAAARTEKEKRTLYGLDASEINIAEMLWALFDDGAIYAWTEETPASQTPKDASGVEFFEVSRPGVPLRTWFSRWELKCTRSQDIARARVLGSDVLVVNPTPRDPTDKVEPSMPLAKLYEGGDVPYKAPELPERLRDALFFLTGQREGGDSMERYLPAAIDDILEYSEAVILFHADRDSDCVAIYAKSELHLQIERLHSFVLSEEHPLVEFEVPPMVARWDRVWRQHQDQSAPDIDDTTDSEDSEDSDSESASGSEATDEERQHLEERLKESVEKSDASEQDSDASEQDSDASESTSK